MGDIISESRQIPLASVTETLTDTSSEFNFYPQNHRAVRAEFGWPCIPYEYANINKAGFDSGTFTPQVVSNNVSSNPLIKTPTTTAAAATTKD